MTSAAASVANSALNRPKVASPENPYLVDFAVCAVATSVLARCEYIKTMVDVAYSFSQEAIPIFAGNTDLLQMLAEGKEIKCDASTLADLAFLADYLCSNELLDKCARTYLLAYNTPTPGLPTKDAAKAWLVKRFPIIETHLRKEFDQTYRPTYEAIAKEEFERASSLPLDQMYNQIKSLRYLPMSKELSEEVAKKAAVHGWSGFVRKVISEEVRGDAVKLAAKSGHLAVVQELLASGPISEGDRGYAFKNAAMNGHLGVMQALLANSAISQSALEDAAKRGCLEVVQWLLANLAISEGTRYFALSKAVENGHLEVLKALLANNAVISESDLDFLIWQRAKNDHDGVADYLKEYKSRISGGAAAAAD